MIKDPTAPHHSQARGGSLQQGRSSDVTIPARGLLFDNDGVLVDSEKSVVSSWSRWAVDQGLDPAEVLAAVPGRRAADTVALFVGPEQVDEATATVTRHELEDADATAPVPGVLDLVPQLTGVPWAVVTSGVRELATARLRGAGVDLPDVLVTAEDVTAGKPDPQPYLTGAARLGIPPADLLVLEDSVSGIASGQAAGCRVVGIGPDALRTTADVVVRDLTGARWTGEGLLLPAAALLRAVGTGS
ncbi:HAD-IA family hydrolase [Modestobacter versicolor]|uniref:HAD family hydrolase n=1 Tax=Modestobacter versicolor TaxID=429133 RepID=A0A323VDD9_9ACTN|nr:HAD-IA family hydrolase [Modestobacter versicolor]MBB3676120.1 sugar-phosphatase [Modestobacter versicolor]PZA22699.1 HAD family hydrolase [Modestobacter versicolor]